MSKTAQEQVERVCHFHKLSIRHNGDIFPCCVTSTPNFRVANIFDDDLENKIYELEDELLELAEKYCK